MCGLHFLIWSAPCLQAARELEAADKARQEAKTAAATKAAAEKEAKTEAGDSKLTKSASLPKAGDPPKGGTNKGTKEDARDGKADDDCTPRDSDGNELAVDIDANKLTAAQLQEELTKRGLDVKWQPLKGKKVLVERLQVEHFLTCTDICFNTSHYKHCNAASTLHTFATCLRFASIA